MQTPAVSAPSGAFKKGFCLLLPASGVCPAFLGLWLHRSSVCLHRHITLSPVRLVSFCFPLISRLGSTWIAQGTLPLSKTLTSSHLLPCNVMFYLVLYELILTGSAYKDISFGPLLSSQQCCRKSTDSYRNLATWLHFLINSNKYLSTFLQTITSSVNYLSLTFLMFHIVWYMLLCYDYYDHKQQCFLSVFQVKDMILGDTGIKKINKTQTLPSQKHNNWGMICLREKWNHKRNGTRSWLPLQMQTWFRRITFLLPLKCGHAASWAWAMWGIRSQVPTLLLVFLVLSPRSVPRVWPESWE